MPASAVAGTAASGRRTGCELAAGAGGAVTVAKSSFGLALQAGVDYAIDKNWSLNLDIKKVQIGTNVYLSGADLGEFKINPLLVGLGVGYKF